MTWLDQTWGNRRSEQRSIRYSALLSVQIFRFAKRKGYISDPPVIAIPASQTSRPDISETEWRTLYTYLRKYVKEAQDKKRHRERFYLQHYILILARDSCR